jgi:3,4-dehydroadipyl-CoA semialdehyde dehydrogenase
MILESHVEGSWRKGSGEGRPFINPVTGDVLGRIDDTGIDQQAAVAFARREGTPALAALSFAERADLLGNIVNVLVANRDRYFEIARLNSGNTKTDATIDIDGSIGTLKWAARLARSLGSAHCLVEAGQDQLVKEPVFFSRHLWTSRPGVAVQINAFNFPAWGMWEKVATAIVAGVASIAKPASATAWLPHEMVRDIVAAGVLPPGALSLVCGSGKQLASYLGPMDSLAFTGSSDTGLMLRDSASKLKAPPRLNVEADSINATVLGPDATSGSAISDLLRREVGKALSIKAGQLCTNIRRVFVPEGMLEELSQSLVDDAAKIVVGDPASEDVRMGPLVDHSQRDSALDNIGRLKNEARVLAGGGVPAEIRGGDAKSGSFVAPTILRCDTPTDAVALHQIEVFGPCVTLMPYRSLDEACELVARSGGALALSLFTDDPDVQVKTVAKLGPWHGRVLIADSTVGKNHTGHSIVMPQCVHGGPGHAGGGEELGGLRGLRLHMQRSAIQGSPATLEKITEDAAEAAI